MKIKIFPILIAFILNLITSFPVLSEDNTNSQSKWTYGSSNDPMTSKSILFAELSSENMVDFSFPYSGQHLGGLLLRDHPAHGTEVMFVIAKGQILCNTFSGCSIEVRFDDKKAEKWKANGPADNSNNILFIKNPKTFIKKLLSSNKVLIKVPFYQQGEPVFEFHVKGLEMDKLKNK